MKYSIPNFWERERKNDFQFSGTGMGGRHSRNGREREFPLTPAALAYVHFPKFTLSYFKLVHFYINLHDFSDCTILHYTHLKLSKNITKYPKNIQKNILKYPEIPPKNAPKTLKIPP